MALHTSTIRPNLLEVSTCSHLQVYLVLYLPPERKEMSRGTVLDLFSCSSRPTSAKKLCVDMFSNNYSPSLYFPLMYISPYRNQGFCLPSNHSHLKLPWISKRQLHPPSSIQTSPPSSSSSKQTAPYQAPPFSSLFCIQKKKKRKKKSPLKYFHARSVMYRKVGKRSSFSPRSHDGKV